MSSTNGIQIHSQPAETQVNRSTQAATNPQSLNENITRPAATGSPKLDQATLSAATSIGSQSDVRADKVAALQLSIANGTYHVPASEVAGKIIASLLH